ncbi:DUF421 domain-containing protein [Phenylobacterium sp.]|jgi:uncharacterized membrane protein YcaP (DUF421 family)|uniref:DUF421 domain-containing protein n=1 Tax=Phenylobacterium sp. TaxID=1871053 RepID=UPI002E336E08|nr:YetF domain-containing protein [Phenylobacterium sp.]HEX2559981.1 YetF domain-containing protein [Phenylobacterium sp.]
MDALSDLLGRAGEPLTWLQMSARAVVIFAFGVFLVRVASKRAFGKWDALDIIVSIVIGSNLSRALTGNAPLLPTMAGSLTLILLHAGLAHLAVLIRPLGPLLKGKPAQLIVDGKVDETALRRHGIGHHDLEEALRSSGVEDVAQVRSAWIERNGSISVVKD